MTRRRLGAGLVAFLLAAAGAAWWTRPVAGAHAEPGVIARRAIARGVVEPTGGIAKVRTSIAGTVRRVAVREGDRVVAGDPLCTVLGGPGEMPSTVRATVDGVVVARHVEVGDDVVDLPAQLLFELADVSSLRVRIEAEAADAPDLAAGQDVTLTPPGGGSPVARGTLEKLAASLERRSIGEADPRLRADAPVRQGWVTLTEGGAPMLVGQALEAVISLPDRRVEVRVPRGAIEVVDGWATVRVPGGLRGREERVTLGASDATHVEVSGIAAGTPVVVR